MHQLLARAGRLAEIQSAIRDWARNWAGEPLASSLIVANERNGILLVYTNSAAALTQVRYSKQELIQFLHQRLGLATEKIDVKINPSAQSGG